MGVRYNPSDKIRDFATFPYAGGFSPSITEGGFSNSSKKESFSLETRIILRHKMGIIIAFLGKQSQKGHTYPTIIHVNIIPNLEKTVNRIEKLVNFGKHFVRFAYFEQLFQG